MLVGTVQIAEGGPESIGALYKLLAKEGIKTHAHPDFFAQSYKTYGIDEARELKMRASTRAVIEKRRVFVIVADTITVEAQNALLKTLEETSGEALFIFVVQSAAVLLPTVRSRAQALSLRRGEYRSDIDTGQFLAAAAAKRVEMLKPLLEKGDDDKRDLGALLSFLAELERALEKNPASLEAVYRARKYLNDRGALVKPLLEQMALLI